jgi:hypothetical protein
MACNWLFLLLALQARLTCSANKDCYSGCCNGNICSGSTCVNLLNYSGYCEYNTDCKSGSCNSHVCEFNSDNFCISSSDCLSDCCSENYCVPPSYCYTSSKEEGEYCTSGLECINATCYNGYCDSTLSGLYGNTWYCKKGEECISGCCFLSNCTPSSSPSCVDNPLIQYCEYDYECDNHDCANGLCTGIVDYNSGSVKFILIGLPLIGAAAIAIGIVIMLKCCTKFLVTSNIATPQPLATQAALNLQVTNM